MKYFSTNILYLCSLLIMVSCANIGSPTGGPKDETPPVMINSIPLLNQTKVKKEKITLFFDEIVVLKEIKKNFIVSPPQKKEPRITALGKKVSIELNNELIDSTTYTIYLGSSIVDNNAGNPLPDLTFSFATGNVIDSMELSGTLLNAKDLEPIASSVVGIYKDLSDSAVIKKTPLRIAQTNAEGKFVIKNVAPGKYHIFGLTEMIRSYRYDNPSDDIAFLDSIIVPDYDSIIVADTIWQDTITIDTIIFRDALSYGPKNLTLLSFNEFEVAKNIKKKERKEPWQLMFSFSSSLDSLPKIRLKNNDADNWYLIEKTVTGDSIIYWITDSTIYKMDTLNVILDYQKTDTLDQIYWETDTFNLAYRKPKPKAAPKTRKDKDKKEFVPMLGYTTNFNGSIEINAHLQFVFDSPISEFDMASVRVYKSEDTLKTHLPIYLEHDSVFIRKYHINGTFLPGESYTFDLDSAAITNIYGLTVNKKTSPFSVKKEDQYGNLDFLMSGLKHNGVLLLLNSKGEAVKQKEFTQGQPRISFKLLTPGTYYASIFYDLNADGEWTKGNYLEHRQAEEVRFFSKAIEIKPYRDYEEDWNPEAVELTRQKPVALNKKKGK